MKPRSAYEGPGQADYAKGRAPRAPGTLRERISLAQERLDPELAVLVVARHLEALGRSHDAAVLKLELGDLLIRAALHREQYPDPVALGHQMYAALRLEQNGVQNGVRKKPAKKVRR